jgi:hypothetical protein
MIYLPRFIHGPRQVMLSRSVYGSSVFRIVIGGCYSQQSGLLARQTLPDRNWQRGVAPENLCNSSRIVTVVSQQSGLLARPGRWRRNFSYGCLYTSLHAVRYVATLLLLRSLRERRSRADAASAVSTARGICPPLFVGYTPVYRTSIQGVLTS